MTSKDDRNVGKILKFLNFHILHIERDPPAERENDFKRGISKIDVFKS
jgi:hypothetical protein